MTRAMTRAGLALALLVTACAPPADGPPYDVLLTGGAIVDGTGNPRYRGDVALAGDRIVAIGQVPPGDARRVIDVTGLVVAPGFIDMLGWSEVRLLADGRALSKVTQGITTEVTGEGISVGPQTDATFAEDSAYRASIGVTATWRDIAAYFAELERRGTAINLATFVGATQVRKVVLGNADRAPTAAELARMTALVDTAMREGAVGLSTSLVYAPAFYATTGELIALARAAAARGGVYATHLRDEGARIDEALDEAFRIGTEARIPVELWHLKRAGRANWGDMARVLAKIDSARAAGLDVAANVYPYPASATSLDASIPQWAHAGGTDSLLARLGDPVQRARIRRDMENPPDGAESFFRGAGGASGVLVASVLADSLKYLEGKTLAEIAAQWRRDPIDALFDLVRKDRSETGAIYFSMSEDDVRTAAVHWWVSFCTDYGAVAPDGPLSRSGVHPRVYGSFPRVLARYVRDERRLALEQAVRKMTSLPAQRVGLTDRGLLRTGFAADVVVFDPRTIIDRATFERPHQLAEGVRWVIVNGVVVFDDGAMTDARPGRGLRGPGWTGRQERNRS
ncbi:MAG: D-aminoacylase [Gemmatimonadota bacterium]|nr:D-aminoacylase [Gemmatimonadota bacterium]